jgi:hypothetical protein
VQKEANERVSVCPWNLAGVGTGNGSDGDCGDEHAQPVFGRGLGVLTQKEQDVAAGTLSEQVARASVAKIS